MNLLTDPLFRLDTASGRERRDLPGLLEALGRDEVESLMAALTHQEEAIHVFLSGLAAAVLARDGRDDPVQKDNYWREAIRRLTRADGCEDDSAWTLVVADHTRPAFLQPPRVLPRPNDKADTVPNDKKDTEKAPAYVLKAMTPDELDRLPTPKNHAIKGARIEQAEADDWIYALISLQTMSGVYGVGTHGITRMNSGFGSRAVVSVDTTARLGARWRDHTTRLLGLRQQLLQGVWGYRPDGLVCTWIPPWDLKTGLPLSTLDPFFLEICRARRLEQAQTIYAMASYSRAPRIAAPVRGVVGDPFSPIRLGDKAADASVLTVNSAGFTPALLHAMIFEDGYVLTPLQQPNPASEAAEYHFTACVLVGGQCKTGGYHQVRLPIPGASARRLFQPGPARDQLAALSKTAIADSGVMLEEVLKPAVYALLQGGPDRISTGRNTERHWWQQTQIAFTSGWSADYFPWLRRTLDHPDPTAARRAWLQALRAHAETALEEAIARYATRAGRRYRAQVKAHKLFTGLLYRKFPPLAPPKTDTPGDCT